MLDLGLVTNSAQIDKSKLIGVSYLIPHGSHVFAFPEKSAGVSRGNEWLPAGTCFLILGPSIDEEFVKILHCGTRYAISLDRLAHCVPLE